MADTRTKSDSNLGRKGQAVADTRINRLTRWLTDSVNHLGSIIFVVGKSPMDIMALLEVLKGCLQAILFFSENNNYV